MLTPRPPPTPTLFPYTTLFRSGVHRSTISRELRRNLQPTGHYYHMAAQLLAEDRQEKRDKRPWKMTPPLLALDRKSTRLNSSHVRISYAVFCLKKKKTQRDRHD